MGYAIEMSGESYPLRGGGSFLRRGLRSAYYGGVIYTLLGGKSGSCEYHPPTLWRLTCDSQGASRWSLRADAELNGILAFIPDGGDDPNHIPIGLLPPCKNQPTVKRTADDFTVGVLTIVSF